LIVVGKYVQTARSRTNSCLYDFPPRISKVLSLVDDDRVVQTSALTEAVERLVNHGGWGLIILRPVSFAVEFDVAEFSHPFAKGANLNPSFRY
jgi:hypothetical protein